MATESLGHALHCGAYSPQPQSGSNPVPATHEQLFKTVIYPYKRLPLNGNEVVTYATTWITLENTTLGLRSWS